MKHSFYYTVLIFLSLFVVNCRSTKNISKVITTKEVKDTTVVVVNKSEADSILMVRNAYGNIMKQHIDFKTFSAKIKVDYEDSKGKKPDVNAYIKIYKDSLIWINIRSVFLDVEAFRILITPDSVLVVNKLEKEVQMRSMDYLQEITEIPFDFKTLQDLLVGNPVFLDSNIVSYRKTDDHILLATIGKYFKHLLTLTPDNFVLLHSKLDDVDLSRNRTADITYDAFENKNGVNFSTYRQITVSENIRLDIRLNYKQYDFNKELSISFNIPKNYKRT